MFAVLLAVHAGTSTTTQRYYEAVLTLCGKN